MKIKHGKIIDDAGNVLDDSPFFVLPCSSRKTLKAPFHYEGRDIYFRNGDELPYNDVGDGHNWYEVVKSLQNVADANMECAYKLYPPAISRDL